MEDWHSSLQGLGFHHPTHSPMPSLHTHLSLPTEQAFQGLYVSPSQIYYASTQLPPRCKTFGLHTTLKVSDPRSPGAGRLVDSASSLLIMACLCASSEECREKAGKDFAEYFFVQYKDQRPYCITRCMPGFNTSMNCNFGTCKLERSGPRC